MRGSNNNLSQCNTERLIKEKNVIIESVTDIFFPKYLYFKINVALTFILTIFQLQKTVDKIESERDHFKSEYLKFKDFFNKDGEKDNVSGKKSYQSFFKFYCCYLY